MKYLLILLILFLPSSLLAQWNWSPVASHHSAACRVVASDGSAGSGVYVDYQGFRCVLTVAHIMDTSNSFTVTFADGTTARGSGTIDKYDHDVALVFAAHATIKPLSLSTASPRIGDRVEYLGFGGPNARLRHFYGDVIRVSDRTTEFNAHVLNGDSGAAIINSRNEVIGIQSYGVDGNVGQQGKWTIYRHSGSTAWRPIRNFLGRVVGNRRGQYQQGGCEGGSCPVEPNRGNGLVDFYPPDQVRPQYPPQDNPQPPVVEQGVEVIDYQKLSGMIVSQMKADGGFVGTKGKDGKDGIDGKDAILDYDVLVGEVIKRLPPVRLQIHGSQGMVEQSAPLGEPIAIQFEPIQ